jgi:arylsulfatase A-like enzyme
MNIIVICSDTFRYDHLGFLKKQPVQTPHLDRFARESGVFQDFWLCSFPTLVNRIEVFTGRYAFPHYDWGKLPQEYPVLAQTFQYHGFTTALISDNLHLFEEDFGFERGFDFVKNVPGQMHDRFQPSSTPMVDLPCDPAKLEARPHRLDRYRRNLYWYRVQGTTTTAEVFRSAIEWIGAPPDKFFLWIDAFDPHEPWDAPNKFLKPYPWNTAAEAVIWPHSGGSSRYSAAELENMRSLYKAEVTQIDFWVGRLLDALHSQQLLGNTAVIFCSDHGYYFGEHGVIGKPLHHGAPLKIYEELGHLPLLLRHPAGLGAGQAIRGLTQPPDLFATALDLAGIQRVGWIEGHSLVPQLRGEPSPQRLAVGGCHPHKGRIGCLTVWTDEWCFVHSPFKQLAGSELYHAPSDPTHTRNVIAENQQIAQDLLRKLEQWFDDSQVSPARKRQMLFNAPFAFGNRVRYRLWLRQRRRYYRKHYRHYAVV